MGSGLARGAYRPLIAFESSTHQLGVRSGGAAHKNQKRRGVLIALRAHRHFERSREIFIAECSSPDVRQHQDIVFPRRIHTDSRSAVKIPRLRSG